VFPKNGIPTRLLVPIVDSPSPTNRGLACSLEVFYGLSAMDEPVRPKDGDSS
jgi:hypothetical protein